jgi:iron complex transport system substrate-binding protein
VLAAPARRIVSLAPHVTELLFAAGGGERIVGAGAFSDYPEAARRIPRVADNFELDIERTLALKPDVIVVWQNGTPARQLAQLRALGVPLYYSEPKKLDDIAGSVERFGALMGTQAVAAPAAADLRRRLAALRARYQDAAPVPLFYQVWDRPIYTLGGAHIVSDAIRACGGRNVYADLAATAPSVAAESVLQRNPEAVISGGDDSAGGGVAIWKAYPTLLATRRGNLFAVNGDLFSRPGPRLIDGTAVLCEKIQLARSRRP